MGVRKNLSLKLNNKRLYPVVKAYSFYRKDLWGYLRIMRKYKYKRVLYSILKGKKKFYYFMLTNVYGGVKFYVKKYNYAANLFLAKRRLKVWYGFLKDKFIGKLGVKAKSYRGSQLNNFFHLLETRLDVLLVRSLYLTKVRHARFFIVNKNVLINGLFEKNPSYHVRLYDVIDINSRPKSLFFFQFKKIVMVDFFKMRIYVFSKFNGFFRKFMLKFFKTKYFAFLRKKKFGFVVKSLIKDKLSKNYKKYKTDVVLIRLAFLLLYYFATKRKFSYLKFPIRKLFLQLSLLRQKIIYVKRKNNIVLGLYNLRARSFYLKRLLKQRLFSDINDADIERSRRPLVLNYSKISRFRFKPRRYWRISRETYRFLRLIKKNLYKRFFVRGFPPYIEVNYKVHSFILLKKFDVGMVKFPFSVKTSYFYEYFKKKSYF
jgi:ribosomal protein S4